MFFNFLRRNILLNLLSKVSRIFVFCCLYGSYFSNAQNLQNIDIENLTINDGLSQGMIYDILQDRQGFLWFATQDGLNKYDGYTFTVYRNDPNDSTSLPGNHVTYLHEDKKGFIWVYSWDVGLHRFDPKTTRFQNFSKHFKNIDGILNNEIVDIYEDSKGYMWFPTENGLTLFDPYAEQFHHFFYTKSTGKKGVNRTGAIAEGPEGNLYIHQPMQNRVWQLTFPMALLKDLQSKKAVVHLSDRLKKEIKMVPHTYPPHQPPLTYNIFPMLLDENQNLWLCTNEAVLKKNMKSQKDEAFEIYPYQKTHQYIPRKIYEDRKSQTLWIATREGLYGLHKKDRLLKHYPITDHEENPLSAIAIFPLQNKRILSIHERQLTIFETTTKRYISQVAPSLQKELRFHCALKDQNDVIWIGTDGGGLKKLHPYPKSFWYYGRNSTLNHMENQFYVNMVHEDSDKNLWVSTPESFVKIDRASGKRTSFDQHFQTHLNVTYPGRVLDFFEDQEHNYWLLKKQHVVQYNPFTGKISDLSSMIKDNKEAIFKDRKGRIWLFPHDRAKIGWWQEKSEQFTYYYPYPTTDSLSRGIAIAIIADVKKGLWVATRAALYWYDLEGKKTRHYQHDPDNPHSLSTGILSTLCEDPKMPERYLWAGTKGGGLNRLDKKTGKCEHYTTKQGLANDVVYGILADEAGLLWMSTNKGLSRLNPQTGAFRNYTYKDGLQGNEFNTGAFFKSPSGELFFGGTQGLTVFYPDQINDNPYTPPVHITDFKIANRSVSPKDSLSVLSSHIGYTSNMTLKHDQNMISFGFAALDYSKPDKNLYSYKLEGLDTEWSPESHYRIATYTNLAPGDYTFMVKGSNSDAVWNEQATKLSFTILPPWWRTWWAYTLYLLGFLTVTILFIRFQLNKIRLKNELLHEQKEAEQLKAIDEMKTQFFSNITHEFRTPLSLIIGPLEQLLKNEKNSGKRVQLEIAKGNSQRMLHLINQLLDLSKLEGKRMQVEEYQGQINHFIKELVQNFEGIAERKGISLHFHTDVKDVDYTFDPHKLEKIIYNLLSNALKFTLEKGSVSLKLTHSTQPEGIKIEIKDTGIGIEEAYLPKIFDRFYQVDASSTRREEGSGIGLSLTKELIQLMGGSIEVYSELGKGTTFTILLPILMVPKKNTSTQTVASTHLAKDTIPLLLPSAENEIKKTISAKKHSKVKKPVIQIIEDNTDLQNFITLSLHNHYRVITSDNGKEGVKKALEEIPDLIISDVMMPYKNGFEVCDELKNDPRTSHIPIIMLTAKTALESRLQGLKTGADAYLNKPFSMEELEIRIEKLIAMRRSLQVRYSKEGLTDEEGTAIQYTALDKALLSQLHTFIEQELSNGALNVDMLCHETGMSRTQLHRKLKALTNLSATAFIRNYRLSKAMELLKRNENNVNEIAWMTGFNTRSYFTKCFTEKYQLSPTQVNLGQREN